MESRTKNVSRNILIGSIYKVVTLLLPFISRTLLLYLIGATSLGATTLFASILSFLSLAELGVGAAVIYSMYEPIAKNDVCTINNLLSYYRNLYRVIGLVVLGIGILLLPFLPYLIKGDKPNGVNLYLLYCLYLFNSVISYFAAGYRQSLLIAYQRSDLRDKISLFVSIAVRIGEIVVISFFRNLYLFVAVSIIGTIITNILTATTTRHMFPNLHCEGKVDKDVRAGIRKRLGGLFGTKLNSIVVHQADTMVISAFLGLTLLAQYGNYYYIVNAVSGFVMMLFSSMTASIGNKIASDTKEAVFKLFKKINFINNWIVGWSTICLLCLTHPFMIIWVKNDLTLPVLMSILMALYFYVYQIQRTLLTFKDAGGLWYEDRYRPYVSMVFNVVSNIILVQFIGIYGIVLSTILAFLISVPWCNHVVFKVMFQKSPLDNIIAMMLNFIITCTIGAGTFFICSFLPVSIVGLIVRLAICLIIPNILYVAVFYKKEEFKYIKSLMHKVIRRKAL